MMMLSPCRDDELLTKRNENNIRKCCYMAAKTNTLLSALLYGIYNNTNMLAGGHTENAVIVVDTLE